MSPGVMSEFPVLLEQRHADAILSALEVVLNAEVSGGLDKALGPGITRESVEEGGRRIEAAAEMDRRGITDPMPGGLFGIFGNVPEAED